MRTLARPALLLLAPLGLLPTLLACGDKDPGGGDGTITDGGSTDGGGTDGGSTVGGDGGGTDGDGGGTDGGGGDGGTDGGTTEPDNIHGEVSGEVRVQLYTLREEDGEREAIAWEDTEFEDEFPFGAIMVSATQDDGEGGLFYRGQDTVSSPHVSGDPYSVAVTLPDDGNVQLYATLDYHRDGILSTSEPIGTFPGQVMVTDGSAEGDKDITILVNYEEALAWWQGGSDPGAGGGGTCEQPITLSGTASITTAWAGGDVAVLIYDTNGYGPYYYDRDEPVSSGGGAEAPFSIGFCGELGEIDMLGAWDSNGNELIDPADMWGAVISKPDVSANPLDVQADMTGLEVQIPLGDGRSGLGVVPFVSLSGVVTYMGGEVMDKLPTDSTVHVVAMLYRPDGELAVEELAELSYDTDTWEPADYAGQTELDFNLWVPGNTLIYLWAFVDEGPTPDGIVNAAFELVGSGGGDLTGRLPTGTSSTTDLRVDLGYGE